MVLTLYIVMIVSKKKDTRMTFEIPCMSVSYFLCFLLQNVTLNIQHCASVGWQMFALKIFVCSM